MYLHRSFWPRFGGWLLAAFVLSAVAWFYSGIDAIRMLRAGVPYADFGQALGYYGMISAILGAVHGAIASTLEYRRNHYAVDYASNRALEVLRTERTEALAAGKLRPLPPPKAALAQTPAIRVVSKTKEVVVPHMLRK